MFSIKPPNGICSQYPGYANLYGVFRFVHGVFRLSRFAMRTVASEGSTTVFDLITMVNWPILLSLATFSVDGSGMILAGVLSRVLTIFRSLVLGWFQLRLPIFAFGNCRVLFLSHAIDDKSNGAQLK